MEGVPSAAEHATAVGKTLEQASQYRDGVLSLTDRSFAKGFLLLPAQAR